MKILKIALVTVAIQSTAAVTFIQKDSNAQALSESHDTSQTVQEVLQDNGNVEDYNTVTQVPPILDSGIVHHAAELVELAVHDDDSAGSSLNLAVSKNAKGPLDMDLWKQSLGRALELAKVKAGELQEKQVALDIKQWVEDHPWRGQSYVANRETMKATFDMNFWGQSLGEALELAKIKARELHLDQVAMDIERWVEQHPWQAAFYTASFLGFFAPEILSIPALEALGFGLAGVRAGSIAAKVQSVIGPVAARSVFAIWQSARMGGYGVANVNGGVRALIALTDAAVARCNPLVDCKGLISGEARSTGFTSMTVVTAVLCGCATVLIGAS